jgi:hypothetical protein
VKKCTTLFVPYSQLPTNGPFPQPNNPDHILQSLLLVYKQRPLTTNSSASNITKVKKKATQIINLIKGSPLCKQGPGVA